MALLKKGPRPSGIFASSKFFTGSMKLVAALVSCASSARPEFRRPVGILTNIASPLWPCLIRCNEDIQYRGPRPNHCPCVPPHQNLRGVLMQQITSYLRLPTRWARGSGPGFLRIFLQASAFAPNGWQHDYYDGFLGSFRFVTFTHNFFGVEL